MEEWRWAPPIFILVIRWGSLRFVGVSLIDQEGEQAQQSVLTFRKIHLPADPFDPIKFLNLPSYPGCLQLNFWLCRVSLHQISDYAYITKVY